MSTMTSSTRLNFRVRRETEDRLRRAAAACDQSLTDFVVSAAERRADEVLAAHTLVPPDYFDTLIAALEAPLIRNEELSRIARRPRRFKQG